MARGIVVALCLIAALPVAGFVATNEGPLLRCRGERLPHAGTRLGADRARRGARRAAARDRARRDGTTTHAHPRGGRIHLHELYPPNYGPDVVTWTASLRAALSLPVLAIALATPRLRRQGLAAVALSASALLACGATLTGSTATTGNATATPNASATGAATALATPPRTSRIPWASPAATTDAVVTRLRSAGLTVVAQPPPTAVIFGATREDIFDVDGETLAVYAFADADASARVLDDAAHSRLTVSYLRTPYYAQLADLLIVIVSDRAEVVRAVLDALTGR